MQPQTSRFAGEKILIVDDEHIIVELASLLLKKRGFEVLTGANGQECLLQVARHRPALVLLDYMMPVMNGLEALRQIRENFPETYVIMFTGKGNEDTAVELMKGGAADYLQKPFAKNSLQERIDSVLARRSVDLQNKALLAEREMLQHEIREWNRELEQRVLQKSRELEEAQKEIVQAEKLAALGHIAAGMAHDIRNPLNSINLYAELLKSEELLNPEQAAYVGKITEEVERIENILRKMLDSSTLHNTVTELIRLPELIRKVLTDYHSRIVAQNISLKAEIDESCPVILGNPHELEQVVVNLISNALFEMPEGGTLSVALTVDPGTVRLVVSDTGKGLPEEHLAQIFDPFFTTKDKGTGFGLSVVRRVVKNYGGVVAGSNNSEGGARFVIELPLPSDQVR